MQLSTLERERESCDWWGQRLRKILRKKHEKTPKTFAFPCWLCSLNKWPYSIGYATNIVGRGPQHFKTHSGWGCRLHFYSLTSIGLVLALYIGLILAHIYKAKERKKMIVFPLISTFFFFFLRVLNYDIRFDDSSYSTIKNFTNWTNWNSPLISSYF